MTIEFRDVNKSYVTRQGTVSILKNVSMRLDAGEHVGILGQNGAGKSTLIRILGGAERPTSGEVRRDMSVSWPLAFGGAFLGALTGADNVRFVCRLYGVDPEDKMAFVEEFTELGRYLREPVKSYSSGMRARLAFAVSMAIDFDCYLIDEIVAVGDERFKRKCQFELFEKRRDRAMLIVSHNADFVRQHCQRASVLSSGVLTNFANTEEAFAFYASHEMPLQPHMADLTVVPDPQLMPDAVDHFSKAYADLGPGLEFENRLEAASLDKIPIFDSCDVVGRLASSGHREAALHISQFLTSRVPTEPLFWVTQGDLLCARRQHVPGVEAYNKALDLAPDSYWAHRNLANEHFNVGRYGDAMPHFERALALSPQDFASVEMQLRLVDCYFMLDRASDFKLGSPLPDAECLIVDRQCTAVAEGGAARFLVSGLLARLGEAHDLRCLFKIGDEQFAGFKTFARSSIRRLAAVSDWDDFGFNTYALIPEGVTTFETEIWADGRKVYDSTSPIQFLAQSRDPLPEDPLAAARHSNSFHQSELSLIFYGLSEQNGGGSDIIPFAENLIATGWYDEALFRLHHWLDAGSGDEQEVGFVLDLLCAETARARLPNWLPEIEQILDGIKSKSAIANVAANAGHAAVARGQHDEAFRLYERASREASGQALIHFARGIHTAHLAPSVTDPCPAALDPQRRVEPGVVHFFACDGGYFARFAKLLVESSFEAKNGTALKVHAHVIDPTDETIALAAQLTLSYNLVVTYEHTPSYIENEYVRRAYFTCARFLQAPRLLAQYECPIVITETDCLINWDWSDLLKYVGKADVGYLQSATWNFVPWTKIPAGIFYLAPTTNGFAIIDYIARFIEHAFACEGGGKIDLWTVDQVALWLADMKYPEGSQKVNLPMSSVLTLAVGDKLNLSS